MKKNVMFLTSIFIIINAFFTTIVWAWDNEITHKDLSEQATRQSLLGASDGLFLKQLGLSKDIDEVLLWDNHVCDDDT